LRPPERLLGASVPRCDGGYSNTPRPGFGWRSHSERVPSRRESATADGSLTEGGCLRSLSRSQPLLSDFQALSGNPSKGRNAETPYRHLYRRVGSRLVIEPARLRVLRPKASKIPTRLHDPTMPPLAAPRCSRLQRTNRSRSARPMFRIRRL
jgi:hypothetical protein